MRFPDSVLSHDYTSGAAVDPNSESSSIEIENKVHGVDYAGAWIGYAEAYTNGSYNLEIPNYWFVTNENGIFFHVLPPFIIEFLIFKVLSTFD